MNHGFSASKPLVSIHNRYVEWININNRTYYVTSFEKAFGKKLSEMGYKYRPNVPLEEYFFNYGAMIGKLHHLSRDYRKIKNEVCRPHWQMIRMEESIADLIPSEQKEIVHKCCDLRRQFSSKQIQIRG